MYPSRSLGRITSSELPKPSSTRMVFFSGTICAAGGAQCAASSRTKRKLGLRVFRMDQEGGAAIDVGAQHAEAFVGGVPGLHHDVIQFVTQKVFHHALVSRLDFQEVGEHAYRREPALHDARLKQAAHGFGRVSMLGDDGLERTFLAQTPWHTRREERRDSSSSAFLQLLRSISRRSWLISSVMPTDALA